MREYTERRVFINKVLYIAMPMAVQSGITNFVALLDNIMVGKVGTYQMSGVSIVNQLMMVYNVALFGVVSGAGIFSAQYVGSGDDEGVRQTFRFKLFMGIVLMGVSILTLLLGGEWLISLFIAGDHGDEGVIQTLTYGKTYMSWMMAYFLPFTVVQVYSSTLRETGEAMLPMKASMTAVVVNFFLNYLLIFGKFGAPKLGVAGAAIATVISKCVELFVVMWWTHRHKKKFRFAENLYKSIYVSKKLVSGIVRKGFPLTLNEIMWATGTAFIMQCYSVRGLPVVAALNITNTIGNLFSIAFIALGQACGIILGQLLGAGKMKEAGKASYRMLWFSVGVSAAAGVILAMIAPIFPQIYNTSSEVKDLGKILIWITCLSLPIQAFVNTCYFTIRSGGKTGITFLFDGLFLWGVNGTLAFVLSRYTEVNIVILFFLCQISDLIKCAVGYYLMRKGIWINNVID